MQIRLHIVALAGDRRYQIPRHMSGTILDDYEE